MWNVKTKVILVIIGSTGTISESFMKYPSHILRERARNRETTEKSQTGALHTHW
jgi:hypothetical protein